MIKALVRTGLNSSLVMNVFVCSVISYSKVSSRDYLVTSIEHIRLQCAIIFVEASSKDYLVVSYKRVRLKCVYLEVSSRDYSISSLLINGFVCSVIKV